MNPARGRYGWLRTISPLLILVQFLLLSPFPSGAEDASRIDLLLADARRQELHKDPYWLTLLHYKSTPLGTRSLVDDPNFFLSSTGKTDPQAELEATVRAFFQEQDGDGRHPVCRFVARYDWLKEKLHLHRYRLPVPECRPFEEIMNRIRPQSVSLIFPTSHMNSPASMFGHTLLTIDTEYKSKLLSYAVNYSAVTTDTFGPLFAAKGLLGFYKGYFSVLPYYAKIQEYSDVDRRDIWEYPLNLDREEIRRLLMHVYELEFIYSDYYFLDENCSYDLLFLLDVARPSLHLTDQCRWWVIPLDTIRIVKENGLVRESLFRPSQTTKIKFMASLLPRGAQENALRIAEGTLDPKVVLDDPATKENKVRTFDLAVEYLQYRYVGKAVSKETYSERFLNILRARSLLGVPGESGYTVPAPEEPESGHDSNRVSLGLGIDEGDLFQSLRFRPAFHQLTDNGGGFKEGAQIVFVDTALRYYFSTEQFRLESLDLIDIVSLTPLDAFFHPVSWKVSTGFERILTEDGKRKLVYDLNLGGGLAYRFKQWGMWYAFLETDWNAGGSLRGDYAGGIGGSAGFLTNPADFWRIHLFTSDIYYPLGDTRNALKLGFLQNFAISRNMSVTTEFIREKAFDADRTEAALYWNIFF